MCGIVGWLDFARDLGKESDVITAMTDQLIPRGPDASGYWFSRHIALGHRRLIVVDPQGGLQPMVRRRGEHDYVLVYNGELYNTTDIRGELISRGHILQGWSDTEAVLHSYLEWGEDCLKHFNGIYAFAIWDGKKQQLFLARDRVGVKPLFYSELGTTFLFSSEIKSLLAHPLVQPRINREGLAEILALGPARTPGHGVFSGISELKPGYKMTVNSKGVHIEQYWSLTSRPHEETPEETVVSVRELTFDAIKRQLVSDVPLGTLLSGGLDSSIITAIAADIYRQAGLKPLQTFSIDYAGNEEHFQINEFQPNSDTPFVKMASEALHTDHHYCYLETSQLVTSLLPAVLARDLPGMTDIDSSLYLFCREIKKQITVALSGEGADEVFGGYPWFYQKNSLEFDTFPWFRRAEERYRLYSPEVLNLVKPKDYLQERFQEALREVPHLPGEDPINAQMRTMFYLNLTRWMPTLLDRKDRMSMATGLELRVPYTDHRLIEYTWNIPWEIKYYQRREKGLLRKAMTGLLPEEILWRKKSPYPKTHNPAYLEAVRNRILNILKDNTSPLLPLINREQVRNFALALKPDTHIPWFGQLMNAPQLLAYFIQLEYWLRKYKVSIDL